MQGHLRCQERLWMWILRYQESGAGEFDFDCYPAELMHFASFSYEHDFSENPEKTASFGSLATALHLRILKKD